MIHVFIAVKDGEFENEAGSYDVKAIHRSQRNSFVASGYSLTLEDAQKVEVKDADNKGSDSKPRAARNNKD